MKIHEYQGKEIFRSTASPVPRGIPAFTVDEAVAGGAVARRAGVGRQGADPCRRPRQGRRRQARAARSTKCAARAARSSACSSSRTRPVPDGQKVRRLLIEEGADIKKELYVGMVVDRGTQRVALMASSRRRHGHRGGRRDTRRRRSTRSSSIRRTGLTDAEADDVARKIGIPDGERRRRRARCCRASTSAFDETDASLAEINPLIVTGDGKRRSRSTPSSTSTATRCSAIPTSSRCATSTRRTRRRSRRRSSTCRTSRSTATSAASSTAPGLAMATMDIDQALRRRARELPRRRRRRDGREGDRSVQDHAAQPEARRRSSSTSSAAS